MEMDVRNNFIFIDSNNLDNITGEMYGWCIIPMSTKGEQESLCERYELFKETYDGSYVVVQVLKDEVRVCQDAIGSRGLYLYQEDGYFALSDSFMLLIEKLSKSYHQLTLNRNYLDSFLLNGYTMETCLSTPVLEVQELPRNVTIRIDKYHKKVSLYEKELDERSVDICSQEAMDIIDSWYNKWTGIICSLIKDKADISVDLSGGFDSRLIFMLMVGANPQWEKINIQTYEDKVHTHKEDYDIAEKIANHYGIRLNEAKYWERLPFELHNSLAWSFYIRSGFHKQLQFQTGKFKRPLFHFAGLGGETIRHYHTATKEQYIENYRSIQKGQSTGYNFMPGFLDILDKSEEFISGLHNNYFPEEFGTLLWNEGGDRHHHGKEMAEAFGGNEIRIGPILDGSLQKLRYSEEYPYLLNTLLLMRYEPDLLDFEFDSNRVIPEKTLQEAKRINTKYPKAKKEPSVDSMRYEFISNEIKLALSSEEEELNTLWEWCKRCYASGFVKGNMGKLYPARVYEYAKVYYEEHAIYPMEEMWAAIAVAYCVYYSERSRLDGKMNPVEMLEKMTSTYATDVEDFMPHWPVPEHRLSSNCRIILYGAGKMGQAFYKQIIKRGLGEIVLWVDKEPKGKGEQVRPLTELSRVNDYNVILVAIQNRKIQKEVVDSLRSMNLQDFDEDKIVLG